MTLLDLSLGSLSCETYGCAQERDLGLGRSSKTTCTLVCMNRVCLQPGLLICLLSPVFEAFMHVLQDTVRRNRNIVARNKRIPKPHDLVAQSHIMTDHIRYKPKDGTYVPR